MTTDLIITAVAGLLVAGSLVTLRWREQRRRVRVAYSLHFPRTTSADQVSAFLSSLTSLLRPGDHLGAPLTVVAEVHADEHGLHHRLLVPREVADVVVGHLRAAIPGVVINLDDSRNGDSNIVPTGIKFVARELRLTKRDVPLRTDQSEVITAALLTAMGAVRKGEHLALQWMVAPTQPQPPPAARESPLLLPAARRSKWVWWINAASGRSAPRQNAREQRDKLTHPVLQAVARVGARSSRAARSSELSRQLVGVLNIARRPGVAFAPRVIVDANRRFREATVPITQFPVLINTHELVGLLGFPIGGPHIAGLTYAGSKQLPPASAIPTGPRVIAHATFPGAERPLGLSLTDSMSHLLTLGGTGVGKSTLLASLIVNDMRAGRSVVVIDPKGDLVTDVLERVPDHRQDDVVLLDPTDDRPVGLNPLAGADRRPELVADQLLGILHRLWAANWGPRTAGVLHASLLTLAQTPGMTLVELPLLLSNDAFRRQLVGRLDDPVALEPWWAAYDSMSVPMRAEVIAPAMTRMRQFLLRPSLRQMLGQAEPTFTLSEVLNSGKVLLVSLAQGVLGDEAAALLGSLLVGQLWQAVQSRAAIPHSKRRPAFVTIDEFPMVANLPTPMSDVLAQARGLAVGFQLAAQHLSQLAPELRDSALTNCRAKAAFQLAASDAALLARDFGPLVDPTDFQGLGRHEVLVRLPVGLNVMPPVSAKTMALSEPTGHGEAARASSRARYGVPRSQVEDAIRARHQSSGGGPVGGRRRP